MVLLLCACGGQNTATVATFNLGLAYNYVPYADSRQPVLMESIGELQETDLICLQELWTAEDIEALSVATEATFPSRYIEVTEDNSVSNEPACVAEEIDPLVACSHEYCVDTEDL